MIPIHGGPFSSKLSKQLEGYLQSLKFWLQPLMLGSWDSKAFLLSVSPQWQILRSYCMTIMRFDMLHSFLCAFTFRLCPWLPYASFTVLKRYSVLERHQSIWIRNQCFEFLWGGITLDAMSIMFRYTLFTLGGCVAPIILALLHWSGWGRFKRGEGLFNMLQQLRKLPY